MQQLASIVSILGVFLAAQVATLYAESTGDDAWGIVPRLTRARGDIYDARAVA